jgi:pimeloyl-ACP methyl ester carboxylesterase
MPIGYRLYGQGPIRVIAFHGWFGSSEDWWPLQAGLDPARFTFAFMDQRGYGLSRDRAGNYSVEEVARDGVALADHLGWADFHLMGHSMGGKVVQQVLRTDRARVRSCVALTPVPASGAALDEAGQALFGSAASSTAVRAAIIAHSVGQRLPDFWVQALADASVKNATEAAFGASFRSWALEDFAQDMQGVPTPMLVVAGEHDPALNAQVLTATFLAWYPNARLEVIANAGHYPQLEVPVYTASRVAHFLQAQPH